MAEPADAMEVARVHVRSWQVGYRSLLPENYLSQIQPEERARRYDFANDDAGLPKTVVATEGEAILGFATTSPSRDCDLPSHGELCALYVDPEHWGRGVGAMLLAAAREQLIRQGFREALLWMMTGNLRADRFYRADAWLPDGNMRSESVWNVTVNEIRYQRKLV